MNQITIEELQRLFPGASKSTLERNMVNPQMIAMVQAARGDASMPRPMAETVSTRIRQSTVPALNKTERRFVEHMKASRPDLTLRVHAKTYLLANGVRYTPEVTAIVDGVEWAWEVKGKKIWDDAVVKIKVAAQNFPEITWIMVWEENGTWMSQKILPVL